MALTTVAEVADQVEKFWSPMFMKQLRANLLLGSIVNKDYQGQIQKMGDRVRVSQINKPTGELRVAGTDADSFNSETLSTTYIDITANRRAVSAFEFEDLVDLQSQLSAENSEIRDSLMYAVSNQINEYLYSLAVASTSAPDHTLNSVSDMNAAQLSAIRLLAAQAKWGMDKPWYGLLDPSYYSDVLNASTLTSSDYGASDAPVIGGQIVNKRFGFNLLEDNSRATDKALFLHPDALCLVMQQMPRFKVSDQHANKKFTYVISCDVVFGASLGIDGAKKMITAVAT